MLKSEGKGLGNEVGSLAHQVWAVWFVSSRVFVYVEGMHGVLERVS